MASLFQNIRQQEQVQKRQHLFGLAPTHSEIKIAGYSVRFPAGKKPFPAQLGVMNTVLRALHSSQNALIESPTGTGKTLALLASCLSWQREHYFRSRKKKKVVVQSEILTTIANSSSNASRGGLAMAGGVPMTASTACAATISSDPVPVSAASSSTSFTTAASTAASHTHTTKRRIYFASRTHSQLSQVIIELKKCDSALEWKEYRPNAVVLASRRHYCINDKISSLRPYSHLGNACKSLLEAHACQFAKRAPALTAKADRLCDIEDLVSAGRKHKACPYYASQDMANASSSSLVLCP